MIVSNEKTFRLPSEVNEVPADAGGVYCFRLAVPSDAQLGLLAKGLNVATAHAELLLRARRYEAALSSAKLTGGLITAQAEHLRQSLQVHANSEPKVFCADNLEELAAELGPTQQTVILMASILRYATCLAVPMYVGMTARQSFRQRLDQHMSGMSQFSDRLRENRLQWNDLNFVVHPMAVPRRATAAAERAVQGLVKPRLSVN